MRVYIDNCCYNRPFDDRTNIKNYLEREAILLVFELSTTPFDSLHLAAAEGNTDVFLTTDIKLIKVGKRADLSYEVMNPIEFIMEVGKN